MLSAGAAAAAVVCCCCGCVYYVHVLFVLCPFLYFVFGILFKILRTSTAFVYPFTYFCVCLFALVYFLTATSLRTAG